MNIVIVGIGKVGSTVTEYLAQDGHDVVVVDKSPQVVEHAITTYDVMGICGNGAAPEVLKEADGRPCGPRHRTDQLG